MSLKLKPGLGATRKADDGSTSSLEIGMSRADALEFLGPPDGETVDGTDAYMAWTDPDVTVIVSLADSIERMYFGAASGATCGPLRFGMTPDTLPDALAGKAQVFERTSPDGEPETCVAVSGLLAFLTGSMTELSGMLIVPKGIGLDKLQSMPPESSSYALTLNAGVGEANPNETIDFDEPTVDAAYSGLPDSDNLPDLRGATEVFRRSDADDGNGALTATVASAEMLDSRPDQLLPTGFDESLDNLDNANGHAGGNGAASPSGSDTRIGAAPDAITGGDPDEYADADETHVERDVPRASSPVRTADAPDIPRPEDRRPVPQGGELPINYQFVLEPGIGDDRVRLEMTRDEIIEQLGKPNGDRKIGPPDRSQLDENGRPKRASLLRFTGRGMEVRFDRDGHARAITWCNDKSDLFLGPIRPAYVRINNLNLGDPSSEIPEELPDAYKDGTVRSTMGVYSLKGLELYHIRGEVVQFTAFSDKGRPALLDED